MMTPPLYKDVSMEYSLDRGHIGVEISVLKLRTKDGACGSWPPYWVSWIIPPITWIIPPISSIIALIMGSWGLIFRRESRDTLMMVSGSLL